MPAAGGNDRSDASEKEYRKIRSEQIYFKIDTKGEKIIFKYLITHISTIKFNILQTHVQMLKILLN